MVLGRILEYKWEAVAKYGTIRKRRTPLFLLDMKSLKKSSERVDTIGEHCQKQRLHTTIGILFIGKERA